MRWWIPPSTVPLAALVACAGATAPPRPETGDGPPIPTTTTATTADTGAHSGVPVDPCAQPTAVTIGTGVDAWTGLSPGDPVTLVHGSQGGWHVDVAGLVAGSTQEVAIAPRVVHVATGVQLAGDQDPTFTALAGYDAATCSGAFYGNRAFLDDTPTCIEAICGLSGAELEVCVTVTPLATGIPAEACATVVATLDPADEPACALRDLDQCSSSPK